MRRYACYWSALVVIRTKNVLHVDAERKLRALNYQTRTVAPATDCTLLHCDPWHPSTALTCTTMDHQLSYIAVHMAVSR